MTWEGRRHILRVAVAAPALLLGDAATAAGKKHAGEGEADVAPPEDLMREHGVLNRILLIYEESGRRVEANGPSPLGPLARAANLVRTFIEQYHERLEEDFLFPRFEKAGRLVDLVATLRRQHQAGRGLTETILRLADSSSPKPPGDRKRLLEAMHLFVRMYRPHEAREDTVLFPALRDVVSPREFRALGEEFEDKEHALFGKSGFEGIVARVGEIEKSLGIFDLDQFTPA
jgi:hemerythrin-like domain-containing protein